MELPKYGEGSFNDIVQVFQLHLPEFPFKSQWA